MSRIKLGLFGANRPSSIADARPNDAGNNTSMIEQQERLAGLTPVERAAAEAIMAGNGTALAA